MADQKLSELTRNNAVLGADSRLYSVVDPSGSPLNGYTKYESIRDQISAYIGAASNPVENVIYVAKNGNDTTGNGSIGYPYLTIQGAINKITTPNQTIIVSPGIYTESILFTQNDTTIIGQQGSGGQQAVILTRTNSNIVDFGVTSRCVITNCNIQLTAGASAIYAIKIGVSGSGKVRFGRTETICTTGGILAGIGYSDGGELTFAHGKIFQTNNVVGVGTETKAAFRVAAGGSINLLDVKTIDVNSDGLSNYSVVATDGGTSGKILIRRSGISIDDDNANHTGLLYLTGTNLEHETEYNTIVINEETTNAGQGCVICNPIGTIKLHSCFNHMHVGQITGTAYFSVLSSTSEITSHFDDIIAANGSLIATGGVYNYVNSPEDGNLQISGSYLNMYDQALTVGKRGADHTTIQDAINAITDAASNKKYVILIYPGTYTENVVLSDYIDLKAVSTRSATIITSSSGTTLTLANQSTIINDLKIRSTGGKIIEVPAVATSINYKFAGGSFQSVSSDSTAIVAIEIKGGNVQFTRSFMHYTQTGTGGGTHRMVNITGPAIFNLLTTNLTMEIADPDDDVIGIEEANAVITTRISSSEFQINRTGVVTGETVGLLSNGTSADDLFIGCYLELLNEGSGGDASMIKTAGNGCITTLQANVIKVLNFSDNHLVTVLTPDIVYSNFDTITAAEELNPASTGTFNAIHAHSVGDFFVRRDILLTRNLEIGGTLALATGTTVNDIETVISSPGSDDSLITEKSVVDWTNGLAALYVKKDGSTPFTNPVAGVTPTLGSHLATKDYADGIAGGGGVNDLGPFVTKDLCDPPVSATVDDKYIVCSDSTASASGVWIGHENDVATAVDSTSATNWTFETPVAGKHGWVTDEGIDYTFNGTSWVATGTLIDHTTIQNIGTNTHALIDTHIANITSNPHSVTKTNIGLSNVTDDAQLKRGADDWTVLGEKTTTVDNDTFLIEDSEDGLAKKYVSMKNIVDRQVAISATDTVQDYLENKVIGTADKITVTKIGTGGDEDLQIDIGSDLTNTITKVHDQSHALGSTDHTASTKALLDTKVSDASLISTLGAEISAVAEKLVPVSADLILIEDSAATNVKKKIQIGNLPRGWHGSETRIKIGPAEFFPNNDIDWKQLIENDGGQVTDSEAKVTEFITAPIYIPTGYKATAYMVYSSANIAIEIFENDITNGVGTSRGAGNANTEVNMTDVDSTTTNYLSIVVVEAGSDIYGAYVTIARM